MKKITLWLLVCLMQLTVIAQTDIGTVTPDAHALRESAMLYLQKQDYANAIMVYNQAIQQDPMNLVYRRELAHVYYLQGDMERGEKMVAPLLKAKEADEETFLTAARIFAAKKKMEEAETAINAGIDKFPTSGPLYLEKGEILNNQKKYKSASGAWEKGVEMAPTYYLNYYKLAKVYAFTKRYWWAIVYGEIFVNMESYSSRTEEVKQIVFENYKFLMADLNNKAVEGKDNLYEHPDNFEEAAMSVFEQLKPVVTGGINQENLAMLRIRFLLQWNKLFAIQYPFELFDYQHKIIQAGYFDAYNQWLFGKLDQEKTYKQWTQQHAGYMNQFDQYFRANRIMPKRNQYYAH